MICRNEPRSSRKSQNYLLCSLARSAATSQIFSTCKKSNSTGVARPKIVTITFNVFLSRFTSSTTPLKLVNGPSLIRTCSPFSNMYFGFGFSAAVFTCVENLLDFVLAQRRRLRARADKAGDLRRVLHHVPRVVGHVHLDQDVAGEKPLRRHDLLAAAHLDDVLGRDQHFADVALQPVRLHTLLQRLGDLLLEARVRVNDVPVLARRPICVDRRLRHHAPNFRKIQLTTLFRP